MSLFRAMTLSLVLVIIIVYVLYLNYLLLGQFFFCLFLAQITSTSLRSYRDAMIKYGAKAYLKWDYILKKSYVIRLILEIVLFFKTMWTKKSLIEPIKEVCIEHTK